MGTVQQSAALNYEQPALGRCRACAYHSYCPPCFASHPAPVLLGDLLLISRVRHGRVRSPSGQEFQGRPVQKRGCLGDVTLPWANRESRMKSVVAANFRGQLNSCDLPLCDYCSIGFFSAWTLFISNILMARERRDPKRKRGASGAMDSCLAARFTGKRVCPNGGR